MLRFTPLFLAFACLSAANRIPVMFEENRGQTLPIGFGQRGHTISSVGVNSDSPKGPWRGATALNASGNGDGFVLTLSEPRIRLLNTELTIGKDQIPDAAVHLGGSVPPGPGIRVSITSADPSRVQVARFFTIPPNTPPASFEFTSLTRDFNFSIVRDGGEEIVKELVHGHLAGIDGDAEALGLFEFLAWNQRHHDQPRPLQGQQVVQDCDEAWQDSQLAAGRLRLSQAS